MAESKRIFNKAKMNRDLDDRLVPPGEYRDALNVGIGRSEGSDVGAVENLRGNSAVSGQEGLEGTTIGSVRDPNNDRVYWFNKGTTIDAIYEYDQTTGNVNPILIDQTSNPLVKPTCNPDFDMPISRPVDDDNTRPPLPDLPNPPAGGCTDPTANNFNSQAVFDNGSCTFDPPPPTTSLGVTISGQGAFVNTESPVTLTAVPTEVLGTASFLWNTGETTSTLMVSGADATITGSVTVTDSGRTAPDNTATANYSVTFSAAALETFTFSWTPSGTIANATIAGGVTGEEGTENVPEVRGEAISITPNTGFQWATLPTISTTSPALPSGVTELYTPPTVGNTTGGSVTLSGSWDPVADYSGVVAITGGSVEMIPEVSTFVFALSPGNASTGLGRMNFIFVTTANDVMTAPTAADINFTGTINGNPITATTVPTGASIANPGGSLTVSFSGYWEAAGINDGGGFGVPAGSNTVIITGITMTFTGGSVAAPTPILPFIETRIGVTGATHTAFPATLVTP